MCGSHASFVGFGIATFESGSCVKVLENLGLDFSVEGSHTKDLRHMGFVYFYMFQLFLLNQEKISHLPNYRLV